LRYRKAIQRTFPELYSVPAEAVDVAWDSEGITVQCAGMTFPSNRRRRQQIYQRGRRPVTVTLNEDERSHLVRRV
jgi:hypothetical protein